MASGFSVASERCLQTLEAEQNMEKERIRKLKPKLLKKAKASRNIQTAFIYDILCFLFYFENVAYQVSSDSLFLQFTMNQEFQAYLGGDDVRDGLNGVSYMEYVMTTRFVRCVFSRGMLERVQFRTVNCRPRYFLTNPLNSPRASLSIFKTSFISKANNSGVSMLYTLIKHATRGQSESMLWSGSKNPIG